MDIGNLSLRNNIFPAPITGIIAIEAVSKEKSPNSSVWRFLAL